MFYKSCNNDNEARTDSYMFSVMSKYDPNLLALKKDVKKHNAMTRASIKEYWNHSGEMSNYYTLQRVQLMARGHRVTWAIADGYSARSYDQSLPHRHATYFDVYRRDDTYAMYNLRRELNEGFPISKLRQLDQHVWELSDTRWQKAKELYDLGLFESPAAASQYLRSQR